MTPDEILAGIAEVAARELPGRPGFTLESRLVEDLELDSIQLLTLAVGVEDHFRVCLDEEEEEAIETVGDLVRAVEGQLGA